MSPNELIKSSIPGWNCMAKILGAERSQINKKIFLYLKINSLDLKIQFYYHKFFVDDAYEAYVGTWLQEKHKHLIECSWNVDEKKLQCAWPNGNVGNYTITGNMILRKKKGNTINYGVFDGVDTIPWSMGEVWTKQGKQ